MSATIVKRQEFKKRIVNLLLETIIGLTQFQISEKLKIARQTVKKYLNELVAEKKIDSLAVGAYTLYTASKQSDHSIYQVLYNGALRAAGYLTSLTSWQNPELLEIAWGDIIENTTIPFEDEIPHLEKKSTPDLLECLLDVVCKIINSLKHLNQYPHAEILPPLGTQSPMTRLIHVKDAGLTDLGAAQHYYLLAGLLQEKLTFKSGIPIIVRVARDIQKGDTELYFEIGFVEQYFIDVAIIEQSDTNTPMRHYLDIIKKYFTTFMQLTTREYLLGNTLHYELRSDDNQQVEEFFAARAKMFLKNLEILNSVGIKSTRKYVPYEDWPDVPFLGVQLITNIGFTFDEYERATMKVFPHAGYNVHYEKIPNGLKINLLEEFDLEALFVNQVDEATMREHYSKLGITSEEYFKERRRALIEITEDIRRKRLLKVEKKRRLKRKNLSIHEDLY